jgi:hypothetical protein
MGGTRIVRGRLGPVISTLSLVILAFMPLTTVPLSCLLALAGLGPGIFVPASNVAIMRTGPAEGGTGLAGEGPGAFS